ncbi:restriction endonuclease subunit S [Staphylococcus gallinarum]|uniref:restriction endonuclease subunit S n=1 Tax=Staphylococcus gallinarum TaxID=1293 RepID=UPI000D1D68F8|nr:restriction endonuclease subunit S [Staphylococcus gallinarum]PTL07743.1 restriction endonuclease subunit S [Staphylococcus gallinarum]
MTNEVKNVPELRFPEFSEEWEEKILDEVSTFSKGKGISKNDLSKDGTPCILYGELYTTYDFIINKIKSKTLLDTKNLVKGKKNQVLIPSSGETPLDIATAAVINTTEDILLGGDINVLTPVQKYDGNFISLSINGKNKSNLSKYAQGKSVVHLYNNDIKKLKIKFPVKKSEQRKIGNFFSKLDRQIELEEQKLAKLEEQKKGYMQKIFSQEIRFKDDNGNSYPEWESAPLFDIFSATKGKSLSKDKISNDGKYECILYGEIYTTYAEKIESIVSRTNYYEGILSQKNDLIFPNSTTTNAWDLATFSSLQKNNVLIGGDISILRTKRSDISSLFYAYYLTNYLKLRKDIAKYAQGITIVHLSFNNFYKIKVQIPSLEEQNSITDFIDSLNQQQKLITNKIKLLKERKKGFLQKMFV